VPHSGEQSSSTGSRASSRSSTRHTDPATERESHHVLAVELEHVEHDERHRHRCVAHEHPSTDTLERRLRVGVERDELTIEDTADRDPVEFPQELGHQPPGRLRTQ
jgi:hypothetical protein